MHPRRLVLLFLLLLALSFLLTSVSQAAVAGRFSLVEGQVDLLRQGKLPAVAAKVQDTVEPGDVIRTKSASRAQIQFIDDSTLTIAPGTRVAVADYVYSEPQGQRRVLLQVFQGLVHCVVKRLLNLEAPDFIMKTHTASLGVRGTGWFTLLAPNFTDVFQEDGELAARSNLSEIPGEVMLKAMHFSRIARHQAPTLPVPVTKEIFDRLRAWLLTGIPAQYGTQPLDQTFQGIPGADFLRQTEKYSRFPEGMFVPPTQRVTPAAPSSPSGTVR